MILKAKFLFQRISIIWNIFLDQADSKFQSQSLVRLNNYVEHRMFVHTQYVFGLCHDLQPPTRALSRTMPVNVFAVKFLSKSVTFTLKKEDFV